VKCFRGIIATVCLTIAGCSSLPPFLSYEPQGTAAVHHITDLDRQGQLTAGGGSSIWISDTQTGAAEQCIEFSDSAMKAPCAPSPHP